MKLKRMLSLILSVCFLTVGFSVSPVVAKAEDNNLPFKIENTSYGIEDNRVKANKIVLTDDSVSFVNEENCFDEDEYYHGNGCVMLKKPDGDAYKYYLIGKNGFVKSYSATDSEKIYVHSIGAYATGFENCFDDLYIVDNPENNKRDIYDATTDKYYSYGAEIFYPLAQDCNVSYGVSEKYYGKYEYGKRLIKYSKNEKYGLLNYNGELLYEAVYDNISVYKNCIVGKKDSEYFLLSNDGKSSTSTGYTGYDTNDDDLVCYAQKNGREAIINTKTLTPIQNFGFENSFSVIRRYTHNGKSYTLASKSSDGTTVYYIVSDDKIVNVNQLLNKDEIYYHRSYSPSAIGFEVDSYFKENVYFIDGEYYGQSYSVYSWITPDGKEIIDKNYVLESNADCLLYKGNYIVNGYNAEGKKSYTIEDKNRKNITGNEYNNIDIKGSVLVCSQGSEESGNLKVDYFSCLEKKIIASDESFDLKNTVGSSEGDHENLEVVSKDDKGNFGIIDLVNAKFSGFIFNYKSCFGIDRPEDDGHYMSFSSMMKNSINEKEYIFWLYGEWHDDNEKCVLINNDFKIIGKKTELIAINEGVLPLVMLRDDDNTEIKSFNGSIISTFSNSDLYNNGSKASYDDADTRIPKAFVIKDNDNLNEYDDPTYKLVSYTGEEIISGCDKISTFSNNMAYIEKDDTSGVINYDGDFLIEGEFSHHYFSWNCNISEITLSKSLSIGYNGDVYIYDFSECSEKAEIDYSDIHKDFKTGDKKFEGVEGYYYKDSYFNNATKYNQSLATMSLCMAFSTYGVGSYSSYDKNVKTLMKQCGFAQNNRYMQMHFNEKPTTHSIGCAIGSKDIDGTTLIAVAVRSGGYESEWASNFNMGRSGDHLGFDESANTVKDYIVSYIQKFRITGDIKVWITGFSRGAAVATQTAAKLNGIGNFAYDVDGEYYTANLDKSRIFAYGFATPAGAYKDSNPHSAKYNNIFNVIEFNDIVPLVAPSYLGFDRYGTTNILPYRECNNSNDFNDYISRIKTRMDYEYNLDDFINLITTENDTIGTFNRKLVNNVAKGIGSRDSFVKNYQNIISNKMASNYSDDYSVQWYEICDTITKAIPDYLMCHALQASQAYVNKSLLAETHANQKYYIYWMQLMDENYQNPLPLTWGKKNYRVVKVNCPVDVQVFDKSDKLVAEIKDDKPRELENSSIISGIDENEQKIIYLPVDEKYNIKIEAREDCDVSYSVEEYNAEFGDVTRAVQFKTVSMGKSETLEAEVNSFSGEESEDGAYNGSSTEYSLTKQNENIRTEYDAKGDEEVSAHTYYVSVDYKTEEGTVYGGGQFVKGNYVKLQAEPKEGYEFDGFYVNENMIDDGDNDKESVRFRVDSDVKVVAKFSQIPQTDPTDEKTDSKTTVNNKTESKSKSKSTAKKSNPIKVTVKTKTIKLKKLKKKAQKVSPLTVKKAKGKVAYKLTSIPKKLKKLAKINSKGVITIKKWKKAKKGTYKFKARITAKGNSKYKSKTVNKAFKIKIK